MISAGLWREGCASLAEYACGFGAGRSKDDPIYAQVTEGRDVGAMRARYSSCGDLGHWLLWRLGAREAWLNRSALGQYRIGQNISLLAAQGRAPTPEWIPARGEIVLVWNNPQGADAHCCVVLGYGAGVLRTANYGAGGMSAAASPGARISSASCRLVTGHWQYGLRRVQRVLDPGRWLPGSAAPDLTGAPLSGEEIDAFLLSR